MAAKQYSCRYCGDPFVPQSNLPGFIDECPDCRYSKTLRSKPPEEILSDFMERSKDTRGAFRALRRRIVNAGVEESKVDKFLLWLLSAEADEIIAQFAQRLSAARQER
jgi:hypothetical protein